MVTYHVLIIGIVQGVYYRASAKKHAENIGVTGWIRNTDDGNVEAFVSGLPEQVQFFFDWCRIGPPSAVINEIIITQKAFQSFEYFSIRG